MVGGGKDREEMSEEAKQELQMALELLKGCLKKNGLSMALCQSTREILFFDTETYMKTEELNGIRISIDSLVR